MKTHLLELQRNSNDEFYTSLKDIEKEMQYYDLEGLKIYCPCDGEGSAFHAYFPDAVCTCYNKDGRGRVYDGEWRDLEGNGDFRSEEVRKYWEAADVIITNPPFSLKTEFMDKIMQHKKRFIIVCHQMIITNNRFFELFKNGVFGFGNTRTSEFAISSGEIVKRSDCLWLTNMEHKPKPKKVPKVYLPRKYDDYDAYDVRTVDVAKYADGFEYEGEWVERPVLGVPITAMPVLDRSIYEPLKCIAPRLGGRKLFTRILIRKITS